MLDLCIECSNLHKNVFFNICMQVLKNDFTREGL